MNVVLLSKTIMAPHFKLLTRLRSCSTRHCRLMWRCFASKKQCLESRVRNGAQLMDSTLPCLVARAAASRWQLCMHWPSHTGCNSTCLQSSL